MTEAEKRVKAIRLYDNWCESDTEDTLEIYCYEKGRADAERDFQNSDYWNDYLAEVIADAKNDAIEDFVELLFCDLRLPNWCYQIIEDNKEKFIKEKWVEE